MPASDVLTAADITEFRDLTVDLAFPDTCEVVRQVSTGVDDLGNDLPPTPATVESGPCALREIAARGEPERVIADRLGWTVSYAVDLPVATMTTPEDTLRVNGARTFHVGGVVTEGAWGIVATAVVEERG